MAPALTLGAYLVRVGVPVAGVLASVVLLGLAALCVLFGLGDAMLRQGLFAAGVLSWMFGVGWGVIVNATPIPATPQRHE